MRAPSSHSVTVSVTRGMVRSAMQPQFGTGSSTACVAEGVASAVRATLRPLPQQQCTVKNA